MDLLYGLLGIQFRIGECIKPTFSEIEYSFLLQSEIQQQQYL